MTQTSTQPLRPSTRQAWLRLVRVPNLLTVPGDLLAGMMLGAGALNWAIIPLIIIGLCLYSAGLIMNDLFDYEEDLRERPNRPLPSGVIPRRAAKRAASAGFLIALGISACLSWQSLGITALLSALICLYNGYVRQWALAGFIVMGLCRGTNICLGASLAGNLFGPTSQVGNMLWIGAGTETLYIVLVTCIALKEAQWPALQRWIGKLIRGLILLQAAMIIIGNLAYWPLATMLVVFWFAAGKLGKKFYSS